MTRRPSAGQIAHSRIMHPGSYENRPGGNLVCDIKSPFNLSHRVAFVFVDAEREFGSELINSSAVDFSFRGLPWRLKCRNDRDNYLVAALDELPGYVDCAL